MAYAVRGRRRALGWFVAVACIALAGTPAEAQTQVKPYLMLLVDTSGSMAWDDQSDPSPPNSCGYPSSPMNDAKCAITRVVNATGDAVFGLMQFDQPCRENCCQRGADDNENVWTCGTLGECSDTIDAGLLRVPIVEDNQGSVLRWVDNVCGTCDDIGEMWARGGTPTSGAMRRARWYFQGSGSGTWETPFWHGSGPDPYAACRPAALIVLTDGESNCGGDPAQRARELRNTTVTLPDGTTFTKDIRTYAIGFRLTPPIGELEDVAREGGTDAPGPHRAFYASDEESLALALSQIIADSVLVEVCDGVDNDCDGEVDDGLGVGAPCGTDVGECVPGFQVCRDGMVVCEGGVGPTEEVCNGLDDDCDGEVDEGLPVGEACGSDVGACMPGTYRCVDGEPRCVGEVPPGREVCDCEDNDCDGEVDEAPESGALCPDGSRCIGCGCALPCDTAVEFGPVCPTGRVPERQADGTCWCVPPRCEPAACASERIEADGELRCAPDDPSVAPCVCLNNRCTFACDGVACEPGLVCAPRGPNAGRCVQDDCRGLGCLPGELCNPVSGACEPDPCADVTCAPGEACVDGRCERSCVDVTCAAGERCRRGVCEPDPCAGVDCPSGQVCEPGSGTCTDDRCSGVDCPEGEVCEPASGSCVEDPCLRVRCPSGARCQEGECVAPPTGGGSGGRDGGGAEAERVLATGGGGCACSVGGSEPAGAAPWLLLGLLVWLGRRGRRRPFVRAAGRAAFVGQGEARPPSWWLLLALLAAAGAGGCDVDPYCLRCPQDGAPADGGADAAVDAARDAAPDAVGEAGPDASDAGADGPACDPTALEACNGLDDDCDGETDEDFDLSSDPTHCGACDNRCEPAHAFGPCVDARCELGRCDVGWHDLDGDAANGCEYACTPSGVEVCNGLDDDCDGATDEDLTPPSNFCNPNGVCAGTTARCAGAAGWTCDYPATYEGTETRCDDLDNDCDGLTDEPFAAKGAECGNGSGACRRTGVMVCNAAGDGLECDAPPAGTPSPETCNGLDDDCDGLTDEPASMPGSHPSYVQDAMVTLPSGVRIYAYEASRPDATAGAQGESSARACSRAGVMPWTNVTRAEAEAACNAAGLRLCTEAEWQQACEAASACDWSYASGCTTYQPDTCNGNDYDPVPGAPDDDQVLPGGSMASCYADWGAAGRIFDMSGNVWEWTAPRRAGVNPLRGGAMNVPEGGLRCDFDFRVADDAFQFFNVGFRCCGS